MHRSHTRTYMHTFDSVHPKYNFQAVMLNYTLGDIFTLRTYMHTYRTRNKYIYKVWICSYQGDNNNID